MIWPSIEDNASTACLKQRSKQTPTGDVAQEIEKSLLLVLSI
jgi:hypothetical protein